MAISRVKPAGWSFGEKLTSAQATQLDTNIVKAVSGDDGGVWAPAAAIDIGGAGLRARVRYDLMAVAGATASYQASLTRLLRIPASLTASNSYTLSATGALSGDVFEVYCDRGFTYTATILDQSGAVLIKVGNSSVGEAWWATFVYDGGWQLLREGRIPRCWSLSFPWSDSFVAPAPVLYLRGFGAGGQGGGGAPGAAVTLAPARGGGGGAGAVERIVTMAATVGTSYAVTIGSCPNLGTASNMGSDGGNTTCGSFVFRGGRGGGYYTGTENNDTFTTLLAPGGNRVLMTGSDFATYYQRAERGCGGSGGTGLSRPGRSGGDTAGCVGGVGGANGTVGYNYVGGGGGGGGGAGPSGDGATGGAGGNYNNAGTGGSGSAGTAAADYSGAGGGGGGGGGGGTAGGAGAAGGAGSGGYLEVTWTR